MSEGTEIIKTELQEMARAILCEIYGGGKLQSGHNEPDYSASVSQTASLPESSFEEYNRRSLRLDDEGTINRKPSSLSEPAEFYPRLNRGEFFEQRIQRRAQRQAPDESGGSSSASTENYSIKTSDNLTALDLSEKLSDNFCRDARRYDGAFERY